LREVLLDFPWGYEPSWRPDESLKISKRSAFRLAAREAHRDRYGLNADYLLDEQQAEDLPDQFETPVVIAGYYRSSGPSGSELSIASGTLATGHGEISVFGVPPDLDESKVVIVGEIVAFEDDDDGGWSVQARYSVIPEDVPPAPRWVGLTQAVSILRSQWLRYVIPRLDLAGFDRDTAAAVRSLLEFVHAPSSEAVATLVDDARRSSLRVLLDAGARNRTVPEL